MITEHLAVRHISDDAYAWYLRYLQAIDDKDVVGYGKFLAEDCVMVQNNQDPVIGKANILGGLTQYWQSFGGMTHDLLGIYGTDDAFVLEARNNYVRLDGGEVSVRAVALTDRNAAGLVTAFRFYTDVSPVFAPKASKS